MQNSLCIYKEGKQFFVDNNFGIGKKALVLFGSEKFAIEKLGVKKGKASEWLDDIPERGLTVVDMAKVPDNIEDKLGMNIKAQMPPHMFDRWLRTTLERL